MSPMDNNPSLSFEVMQAFIDNECGSHLPLSFLQGHMLAWFVLHTESAFEAWQESFFDIFPQLTASLENSEFLPLFWQKTRQELYAEGYVLRLSLPDDDESIGSRLIHLSSWAKGFMQPFGDLACPSREWSDVAMDLLTSINALVEVDPESVAGMSGDEAETHFVEITEFARLAPYLMMTNEAQEDGAPPDETLH